MVDKSDLISVMFYFSYLCVQETKKCNLLKTLNTSQKVVKVNPLHTKGWTNTSSVFLLADKKQILTSSHEAATNSPGGAFSISLKQVSPIWAISGLTAAVSVSHDNEQAEGFVFAVKRVFVEHIFNNYKDLFKVCFSKYL